MLVSSWVNIGSEYSTLNWEFIWRTGILTGSHYRAPSMITIFLRKEVSSTRVFPLAHPVTFLFSCLIVKSNLYDMYNWPRVTLIVYWSGIVKRGTVIDLSLSVLIVVEVRLQINNRVDTPIFIVVGNVVLGQVNADLLENAGQVISVTDGIIRHVELLLRCIANICQAKHN